MKFDNIESWRAEAARRFGPVVGDWRFVCPSCGNVASIAEFISAGAIADNATIECIGRHRAGSRNAFEKKGEGPCNYAGYGLIRLAMDAVVRDDGTAVDVFPFADECKSSAE